MSEAERRERGPGAEQQGPEVGTRFSAKEIHDNILKAADEELDRPAGELIWSSLAAGLLISFSFVAGAFLMTAFPSDKRELAVAIGYPLGFVFVVLARYQLFTENTLEPVIPLLERRDGRTLRRVLRLWAIVLPFNLLAALAIALIFAKTAALPVKMDVTMASLANEAASGTFGEVFYKAIFAGWLVALMAWLVGSTHDTTAQILLIWLTTAPIAALGFKHSIAGAAEAFYRAAIGSAGWGAMLGGWILPAVLGNIVGGVVLVAMTNHGQTRGG